MSILMRNSDDRACKPTARARFNSVIKAYIARVRITLEHHSEQFHR